MGEAERGRGSGGAGSRVARRVLVIDVKWPEPDRDSGSIDAMNLVTELLRLGYETSFYAVHPPAGDRYRAALEDLGVRCLSSASAGPVERVLQAEGECLELCVLSRVHVGGRFFEQVRRRAKGARVIFNTVDLHFVREEREAWLAHDGGKLRSAAATRERELYLVRATDATIVVSSEERRVLETVIPGAHVWELPLAREICPPATGFDARSGIGFVGGFAHAPNVDAVQFFLSEVWPIVLRAIPACEFRIAGPDFPSGMLKGAPARVRHLGPVPDLSVWFETLRLSVAPVRYGAGAKGKVASSLAHGVPCVATPIAVEGMSLPPGAGVLVETSAEGLARRIVEVYGTPGLWAELSRAGLEHARDHLSLARWRSGFHELLEALGLPSSSAPDGSGAAV